MSLVVYTCCLYMPVVYTWVIIMENSWNLNEGNYLALDLSDLTQAEISEVKSSDNIIQ